MRLFDHRALKCQPQQLIGDGKTASRSTEPGRAYILSMAKAHSGIAPAAVCAMHIHTNYLTADTIIEQKYFLYNMNFVMPSFLKAA